MLSRSKWTSAGVNGNGMPEAAGVRSGRRGRRGFRSIGGDEVESRSKDAARGRNAELVVAEGR